MERIVITGAGGFIGSHVAEYFCSRGLRPVCMVRDPDRAEFLKTLPVTLCRGDITIPDDTANVFAGADFVIHCAAKAGEWGPYREFYKANVEGAMNVMTAAIEAGIRDVIITGTNSCYGEENSPIVKTEDSGYNPHYRYFLGGVFPSGLNHYRETKALANIKAAELARNAGINLTIIEPVWVYGEREFGTGFYDFLKTVRSGLRFFPGSRKNRLHTIYARDLARLYFLAAQSPRQGVRHYLACDPEAEYMHTLLSMFCREAGLEMPRPLPKAVVYPPALLLELAALLLRARKAPMLTRARINVFYDNIEYSGAKARAELGFECEFSKRESIAKTVRWYVENNLL